MTRLQKPSQQAMAWIWLVLLSVIWGSSFILIKKGLQVYQAEELGTLRIVTAGMVLLPLAIGNLRKVQHRHWVYLISVGFAGSFIPALLFAYAQTQINSSVAGILNALTPVFTLLVGALFFVQRFNWASKSGTLLGFAGTLVILFTGSEGSLSGLNYYALLVVAATMMYATNVNLIKYRLPDLTSRTITSISLFLVLPMGLIYLFGLTPFLETMQQHPQAWWGFAAVATLGILGTAIALLIFNELVKISSPLFTSSVTYLIPVVAVGWGLLDGEHLLPGHYMGMAFILLGIYLINRYRRTKPKLP